MVLFLELNLGNRFAYCSPDCNDMYMWAVETHFPLVTP